MRSGIQHDIAVDIYNYIILYYIPHTAQLNARHTRPDGQRLGKNIRLYFSCTFSFVQHLGTQTIQVLLYRIKMSQYREFARPPIARSTFNVMCIQLYAANKSFVGQHGNKFHINMYRTTYIFIEKCTYTAGTCCAYMYNTRIRSPRERCVINVNGGRPAERYTHKYIHTRINTETILHSYYRYTHFVGLTYAFKSFRHELNLTAATIPTAYCIYTLLYILY